MEKQMQAHPHDDSLQHVDGRTAGQMDGEKGPPNVQGYVQEVVLLTLASVKGW